MSRQPPSPPPEWTAPEPRQIPTLRQSLIDQMGSPFEFTALSVALEAGRGTINPDKSNPDRAAALLLADEQRRLVSALLYSVTPRMTELAIRAGAKLPNWEVRRSDVPSACGFMVFSDPIGSYVNGEDHTIPIVAVSWGPTEFADPTAAVWLTFWSVTNWQVQINSIKAQSVPTDKARKMAFQLCTDLMWDNESLK